MKQKLEKWTIWLERIRVDLRSAWILNHMYHEIAGMVASNQALPAISDMWWYMAVQHAQTLTIAIRRHTRPHRDSVSLIGLLEDIEANAEILTVDRITADVLDDFKPKFAAEFAKLSAPGTNHLDPAVVRSDINRLEQLSSSVSGYADRLVAHLDKARPKDWPQYKDINESLQALETVYFRYRFVVTGSLGGNLAAGFDDEDWRNALRTAWFT